MERCRHGHTKEEHPRCYDGDTPVVAGTKSGIIFPDLHRPVEDKRAYPLVMQFCEDFKPDIVVNLGDLGNFAGVSHWNTNKFKKRTEYPIEDDFAGIRDHHKNLRRINPDCEIYSLAGNHDDWVEDYIDNHPELRRFLVPERDSGIIEYGIKHIPTDRQPLRLGKMNFIHGWWCNKFNSSKHAQAVHHNIIYGHTHTFQSFTPDNIESDKRFIAWSMGHLSDEKVMARDYLRNRPTGWMLGFGIFWLAPSGDFTMVQIPLPNYKFLWNGKAYKN